MTPGLQQTTRRCRDEQGQDLVEYGLLGSLVAVALMVVLGAFGTDVSAFWGRLVADVAGYLS